MLECTWNDAEAELALRRMLLREKKEKELLANDPERRKKIRESVISHLPFASIGENISERDTL